MSPSAPTWRSVANHFAVDGSLRDIYVFDTDETTWAQFLNGLQATDFSCAFFHGGQPMDKWIERFDDAAVLQQSDPVLLTIMVGPIQLNCHFFTSEEIELDIDPREVTDESRYEELLDFLRWLAAALTKPSSLTHEDSEKLVILQVAPDGDIITGCS